MIVVNVELTTIELKECFISDWFISMPYWLLNISDITHVLDIGECGFSSQLKANCSGPQERL